MGKIFIIARSYSKIEIYGIIIGMKRVWERIKVAVMMVALLGSAPAPAWAASRLSEQDLHFFDQNKIYFWYPMGELGKTTCFGTLTGSTLVEKTMSYLLQLGLTDVAVAGIYGNWIHEGLGAAVLLSHENGTDDRSDIGSFYESAGLYVDEHQVRDLDDVGVMHGLGFAQWSYGRRINLLQRLDAAGLGKYAREWDDTRGVYVYDEMTYDELVASEGENVADGILSVELELAKSELTGGAFVVTAEDIAAQGLEKYGITPGMSTMEALNLVETPAEAAKLFMTTYEMPAWSRMDEDGKDRSVRVQTAEEGLELMRQQGIVAGGATVCADNSSIVETAMNLSWEGFNSHAADDPKPEYVEAMKAVGQYWMGNGEAPYGASCDQFVGTVMRYSGVDPDFPGNWPPQQEQYMASKPDKYEKIEANRDVANLQPGDIFVVGAKQSDGTWGNHIYIYLGLIDGEPWQASASYNSHTAEHFGWISWEDYGMEYSIYRVK